MAIIMDVLNNPNLDYLPDLNEDKPPELIEFEHQVCKANDHFCAIRNDIIRWYLSPSPQAILIQSQLKKTNALLGSQLSIIPKIM